MQERVWHFNKLKNRRYNPLSAILRHILRSAFDLLHQNKKKKLNLQKDNRGAQRQTSEFNSPIAASGAEPAAWAGA